MSPTTKDLPLTLTLPFGFLLSQKAYGKYFVCGLKDERNSLLVNLWRFFVVALL